MTRTTPPRPVDVAAAVSQLAPLARTTTRLHPHPGAPSSHDSSVGGPLLWPADQPWPYCDGPHVPDGVNPATSPADVRLLRRIRAIAASRPASGPGSRPRKRRCTTGSKPAIHGQQARSPCCPWSNFTFATSLCCARPEWPTCSRCCGAPSTTRRSPSPQRRCSGGPPPWSPISLAHRLSRSRSSTKAMCPSRACWTRRMSWSTRTRPAPSSSRRECSRCSTRRSAARSAPASCPARRARGA